MQNSGYTQRVTLLCILIGTKATIQYPCSYIAYINLFSFGSSIYVKNILHIHNG